MFEYYYVPVKYTKDFIRAVWFIWIIHSLIYISFYRELENSIINLLIPSIVLWASFLAQFAITYYIKFFELYEAHKYKNILVYEYYKWKSLKYFLLPKIAWFAIVVKLYISKLKVSNPVVANTFDKVERIFIKYSKNFLFTIFMIIVLAPVLIGILLMIEAIIDFFISI